MHKRADFFYLSLYVLIPCLSFIPLHYSNHYSRVFDALYLQIMKEPTETTILEFSVEETSFI